MVEVSERILSVHDDGGEGKIQRREMKNRNRLESDFGVLCGVSLSPSPGQPVPYDTGTLSME